MKTEEKEMGLPSANSLIHSFAERNRNNKNRMKMFR